MIFAAFLIKKRGLLRVLVMFPFSGFFNPLSDTNLFIFAFKYFALLIKNVYQMMQHFFVCSGHNSGTNHSYIGVE